MGNIAKTIHYLKRNGLIDTWYAVRERTDRRHMDELSRFMLDYRGREALTEKEISAQKMHVFEREYSFSIVVPAYETKEVYLKELIDSVLSQTYKKWQLVIADASPSDRVERVVKTYQDKRICYARLKENRGISANTNEALTFATGDYVGLLDHDDVLTQDALYEVMLALQETEYAFLYTDEDKTDSLMEHYYEPHIKTKFNLDLFLSNNYICHFLVMKREMISTLGFREEMDGAQDYDLVLRAVRRLIEEEVAQNGQEAMTFLHAMFREKIGHVPKILYHWRCHEASTAANPESKRYAYEAGLRALSDFIEAMHWDAGAVHSRHLGFYHIVYHKPIWEVRPDVAAVGGNVIKRGIVARSVVLEGRELFRGLHHKYSGYMHRAAMYMDVDRLPDGCTVIRPKLSMELEKAVEQGMCLLYDPAWRKGKDENKL